MTAIPCVTTTDQSYLSSNTFSNHDFWFCRLKDFDDKATTRPGGREVSTVAAARLGGQHTPITLPKHNANGTGSPTVLPLVPRIGLSDSTQQCPLGTLSMDGPRGGGGEAVAVVVDT